MLLLPFLSGILLVLGPTTASEQERIQRLEGMVLAPCCYSEPVAIHRSDVALQMKIEIAGWVRDGRSDDDIISEYKRRYGTRVLIEPEGAVWWWVNLMPGLALAAGLIAVIWILRNWMRPRPAVSL